MADIWQNAGDEFWNVMKPNESLGIVTINKHELRYWPRVLNYENFLINYFQTGFYKTIEEINSTLQLSMEDPVYNKYQDEVEGYVKAVWLVDGYIHEGGLRKPIGIHWKEVEDKWFIHPGGTRQAIIYFFAPTMIECICFNTNGKEIEFDRIFKNVKELADYTNSKKVYIAVTKEYGTHIPHIHLDGNTIKPAISEYHTKIRKFFRNTKIKANFNLEDYGYQENKILKHAKKTVKINLQEVNRDNIVKALLLLPVVNNYNEQGITIEYT